MSIARNYRHEGGGRAGRLRWAGVCLGLAVILAGCAGTSTQPAGTAEAQPLPIGKDGLPSASGLPRDRNVQLLTSFSQPPSATFPAKPVIDDGSLRLPSFELATDGPLARIIKPSNEGPWSPDQAVLPWAEFQGSRITVHNIRNCAYRTVDDYTVRLYDKTFDLQKLTSIDFIEVPFNDDPSIAHVMISFGFEDKDFLVTSVEVRRRAGQTYGTLTGFLNQFTLMYVLADERDVMWRETIGYMQEAYLYRTTATPKLAQEMFVDVMRRVNKLAREPEFYNTLTNNCTTNLRNHVNKLLPDRIPYDYRVLLPGYSAEMAYDLGLIKANGSFAQTKAAALVNFNAYLYQDAPDFSQKLRGK
jgi:hypothetical protein